MKRLLKALPLLMIGGLARAVTIGPVQISSGTGFYAVDVSSIAATLRVRQNIVIADPSTNAGVAPVDALNGLAVYLATSTLTTTTAVKVDLSATTANSTAVKVDGSAATQPISGSVGQSGTWTVQPGNTANTTAWKVDGSAVTQPVSGTVTGNQGTAGTSGWKIDFSTGVQVNGTATVTQGTAGTSAWKIDASTGIKVTGNALMVDVGTGTWPVSIVAGAGSGGTSSNYGTTVPSAGTAVGFVGGGNNMQMARVDTSSNVFVTLVQPTVIGATVTYNGTQTVSANQGIAGTSAWKVDFSTGVQVVGNVASGSSDSGNSVKIGGIGRTTYQTAVTDGQRADAQLDSEGKLVVMPFAVPALSTQGVTAAMTGTTDIVILSSGGTNINTYVTHLLCTNSHATVGTVINIKNGPTTWYTAYAVAAGGGFSATFLTPLRGAGNSQWSATNATTGSNTYCNLVGYFAKN